MARNRSNEWEFQGVVSNWLNEDITQRIGLRLDRATQEVSKITPQRSDLIVWWDRNSEDAFLEIELKQPIVPITDPKLFRDAEEKAKRWDAPYFAIWNMSSAELYKTPPDDRRATPEDLLFLWPLEREITSVDDWLIQDKQQLLKRRALEILQKAWDLSHSSQGITIPIEASMFVDRLGRLIPKLKIQLHGSLSAKAKADRTTRKRLKQIAAEQGFSGFVEDIEAAVAGQYAYRLVGQMLFYFALRRKRPDLPDLKLDSKSKIPEDLRPYWDLARRYDYEAIFAPTELDEIVPISESARMSVLTLARNLGHYDWTSMREDVLGSIFERLIPREEQILLGQFYTPNLVADLLAVFSIDGEKSFVLDPGCGSGTFLMSAYGYLRWISGLSHSKALRRVWGFDISPFASELSVINLFRQDFGEFDNYPRVVCRSYFELKPGDQIPFPPAQGDGNEAKVMESVPTFDAVIGNPPYLRSQNQDDLPAQSKAALFNAAVKNGVSAPSKTDLFAFFIYNSIQFLKPKARLGFVISASWLTSDSGITLQKVLTKYFRPIAFIVSDVEPFFVHAEINTILVVAERVADTYTPSTEDQVAFVRLRKRLNELFHSSTDSWRDLQAFVDKLESAKSSWQDEEVRVHVESTAEAANAVGNWLRLLRAPLSYFKIFGD